MPEKTIDKEKPKSDAGFAAPRGTHDVLGDEWLWRDKFVASARKFAEFYDFTRVETPVLEDAALFERALGAESELVTKELMTIKGGKGEALALRPENTVGIVRAYAEHRMSRAAPFQKLWYEGVMFRNSGEREGTFREFRQVGFEIIGGPNDPLYDAQVAAILWKLLEEMKIKGLVLSMNSTGCRVCRPIYLRQLQSFYKNRVDGVCADCKERAKTNPLRLLYCKEEHCVAVRAQAPNFFDKLCSPCTSHFTAVLEYLDELTLPYTLDNCLIRSFDFYNRTVFDITVEDPTGQVQGAGFGSLAGGGRYDYLFESLGLKATPGVGGAIGIDRAISVARAQELEAPKTKEKRVFLMHVGELAKKKLMPVIETLRAAGIPVSEALSRESLQAQLKFAQRDDNKLALILGQKEVFEESIIIRDLKYTTQETVPLSRMVEEVKKRLK